MQTLWLKSARSFLSTRETRKNIKVMQKVHVSMPTNFKKVGSSSGGGGGAGGAGGV
jgi:hypothetical protein